MIVQHTAKKGCVIRLHLQDGTAQGKIEAKLDNWVGEVLRSGRSDLEWLLKHERAQKPGVYLLQGNDPSPTDDDRKKVYIGLSNRNLQSRLRHHDKDESMDFWDTACLITASDEDTMNPNNCNHLEATLIKQAINANRASVSNKQNPYSSLSPIDRQTPDNFICKLKLVLPVININFLNPLLATNKAIKHFMFELSHEAKEHPLIEAHANQVDGDFFVLKGSCASIEPRREIENQTQKNKTLREALIEDKILKKSDDKKCFVFTKDFRFSSASAAASVILNGHAGIREWKVRKTEGEKDYSEWRNNPQAFASNFS